MMQRSSSIVVVLAGALLAACGGRTLGAPTGDGSVSNQNDGSVHTDSTVPTGCEAQDVQHRGSCEILLGYAWNGEDCDEIICECLGPDCGQLFGSYGECLGAYAQRCLPPSGCESLDYTECEESSVCHTIYFGGGCINLDTCEPNCNPNENCLCWERGIACVPSDDPCNDLGQGDCYGQCYWVEHGNDLCMGDCCGIVETWGYCAGGPTEGSCEAQEIDGCMDPCTSVEGVFWDGEFCQPIICCCEGPDCADTYDTPEECLDEHLECDLNECGVTGGYCDYGDFTVPSCREGYGRDHYLGSLVPGVCGMGVCCAPCPDPNDPEVSYISHDPLECAAIDWDCFDPDYIGFDNECGCGCRPIPEYNLPG